MTFGGTGLDQKGRDWMVLMDQGMDGGFPDSRTPKRERCVCAVAIGDSVPNMLIHLVPAKASVCIGCWFSTFSLCWKGLYVFVVYPFVSRKDKS